MNKQEDERLAECIRAIIQAGTLQVQLFANTKGISKEEATKLLERNKQVGRAPCSCLETP